MNSWYKRTSLKKGTIKNTRRNMRKRRKKRRIRLLAQQAKKMLKMIVMKILLFRWERMAKKMMTTSARTKTYTSVLLVISSQDPWWTRPIRRRQDSLKLNLSCHHFTVLISSLNIGSMMKHASICSIGENLMTCSKWSGGNTENIKRYAMN